MQQQPTPDTSAVPTAILMMFTRFPFDSEMMIPQFARMVNFALDAAVRPDEKRRSELNLALRRCGRRLLTPRFRGVEDRARATREIVGSRSAAEPVISAGGINSTKVLTYIGTLCIVPP